MELTDTPADAVIRAIYERISQSLKDVRTTADITTEEKGRVIEEENNILVIRTGDPQNKNNR